MQSEFFEDIVQPDTNIDHTSLRETEGVTIHDGFPNPAVDATIQSLNLNQLLIKNPPARF